MAFTPVIIEGGGKPEPDERHISALKEVLALAEAGEIDGLLIIANLPGCDEPMSWLSGDDTKDTLLLADLMLPALKAAALGFE